MLCAIKEPQIKYVIRFVYRYLTVVILIPAVIAMIKSRPESLLKHHFEGPYLTGLFVQFEIADDIIFNLSIGYVVSFIFYIMVVVLPENRKRRFYKKRLINRYRWFRENVIDILMNCYEAYRRKYDHKGELKYYNVQRELIEKLVDYEEFRSFFQANENQNWYAVLNGMQYEEGYLGDLYVEFQLLSDEISFVLNNIDIDDDRVASFFHNFFSHTYRLRNSSVFSEDQAKYFGNFLWEIMAQYSMIDGQRKKDPILSAINQI